MSNQVKTVWEGVAKFDSWFGDLFLGIGPGLPALTPHTEFPKIIKDGQRVRITVEVLGDA